MAPRRAGVELRRLGVVVPARAKARPPRQPAVVAVAAAEVVVAAQ
jgi:hypothetical protein